VRLTDADISAIEALAAQGWQHDVLRRAIAEVRVLRRVEEAARVVAGRDVTSESDGWLEVKEDEINALRSALAELDAKR